MKKNIFDTMERTAMFENINESTIIEKTGVSSERIINGVMEQIKMKEGKTMKKHFTKRTAVYLAAAAILTAAVCSVPAIANSIHKKNQTFDGYTNAISFENAKNMKITTDDENLLVDNVTVGGDDTRAIVEVTLSKKDGSAFAEKEYMTGSLASNSGVGTVYFTNNPDNGVPITDEYQNNFILENDNKNVKITLIGYYSYNDADIFVKGAETVVKCDDFSAYTVDEVLKSYPENMTSEELQEMYAFRDEEDNKKSPLSQQGIYITYTGTEYQVVKGTFKTIDIPFEISLTLDYENNTNEKTIELNKELSNKVFGETISNSTVTVTPYGIDFKVDTQNIVAFDIPKEDIDNYDLANSEGNLSKENSQFMNQYAVITMKDGKNYYTDSSTFTTKNVHIGLTTAYTQLYTPHEPKNYLGEEFFDTSVYIIDTDEIASVSINGVTIYTAE